MCIVLLGISMKIYHYARIGTYHINHNEDSLAIHELSDQHKLLAVMDGCSMGIDSHFCATLVAKLLRKIGKEIYFKTFVEKQLPSSTELLRSILRKLFKELKHCKQLIDLKRNELLSTLVLAIINTQEQSAEVMVIGDGIVYHNGIPHIFDQDDRPDYLGYHLQEEFEEWYARQSQCLFLNQLQDFSIATDGMLSFRKQQETNDEELAELDLLSFLLNDQEGAESENLLFKKVKRLKDKYDLHHTDDLSIIRVIFD